MKPIPNPMRMVKSIIQLSTEQELLLRVLGECCAQWLRHTYWNPVISLPDNTEYTPLQCLDEVNRILHTGVYHSNDRKWMTRFKIIIIHEYAQKHKESFTDYWNVCRQQPSSVFTKEELGKILQKIHEEGVYAQHTAQSM
jgi:hypothetical protein